MLQFVCSQCGFSKHIPDAYAGKKVICPKCQTKNAVPIATPASAAPESELPVKQSWWRTAKRVVLILVSLWATLVLLSFGLAFVVQVFFQATTTPKPLTAAEAKTDLLFRERTRIYNKIYVAEEEVRSERKLAYETSIELPIAGEMRNEAEAKLTAAGDALRSVSEDVCKHSEYETPKFEEIRHEEVQHAPLMERLAVIDKAVDEAREILHRAVEAGRKKRKKE